ncbi:MAG: alpha/beta fold hydrolase [Syntrophothermus sp.]
MEIKSESIHGSRIAFAEAGEGSVLLLVHGIGGNLRNWEPVIGPLSRHHRVIAPDLPGHGESEPGHGDYSIGAFASILRDLLLSLGQERATLVGHSLGGGIAMQFGYQFPEMVERLILVSSGGLGPEVSAILRAASLPGAGSVIQVSAAAGNRVVPALAGGLRRLGLRPNPDVAEVLRGYGSLSDPDRRAAFLATARSVIGTDGQRVNAGERLYLAEHVPMLIVWGSRDPIIPVRHGEDAHRRLPHSRLEVFEDVGHLPQVEAPLRFVEVVEDFLDTTKPAKFDRADWAARFRKLRSAS